MELEVFTTNVELQDIPSYTTNITVEGQLLKLSFMWNERIGKRTLYITDSADQCYLQNTILHPNELFELNANAVLNDLPYSVTLIKTGDQKRVGNIFNWSKDFILCFSRTVDVEVEKLNVVYGITKPSTPTIPPITKPDPPYGAWILNQGYEMIGNDFKYTAYKTNGLNYYDSYADLGLTIAVVRSLYDTDMQQWQATIDAVNELTGVTSWVFDNENECVIYNQVPVSSDGIANEYDQFFYSDDPNATTGYRTPELSCEATAAFSRSSSNVDYLAFHFSHIAPNYDPVNGTNGCIGTAYNKYSNENYGAYSWDVYGKLNPNYDPDAIIPTATITYVEIAAQLISNVSSPNQTVSLLAEAYLEAVASSIFNLDESKQFVKLSDLIDQFETNKVLRN